MLGIRNPAFLGALAGFSPLDLSPALWLDAADTSTITASSGSVSQWNDKSGNGRNVTQATGAAQPTTGANTINGLNVLTFDGSSDVLVGGTAPSLYASSTNKFEVFIAGRFQNLSDVLIGEGTIFSQNVSATEGSRQFQMFRSAGTLFSIRSVVRGSLLSLTRTPANNRDALFHLRWNGTSGTLADGNTTTPLTVGAAAEESTALLKVGARSNGTTTSNAFFLRGWVGEVIIYSKELTSGERTLVYDYVAAKWGVTL